VIKKHLTDLEVKDESCVHRLDELRENYEKKLSYEKEKSNALQQTIVEASSKFDASIEEQRHLCERRIQAIEHDSDKTKNYLESQLKNLQKESYESEKVFKEILDQQEEEYEMQLMNVKANSDISIRDENLKLQDFKGVMQNLNSSKSQLTRQNNDLKLKMSSIEDLSLWEGQKRKEAIVSRIKTKGAK
jgi:hypothetical protein